MPGKPSLYWAYMFSRKLRRGSCGHAGMGSTPVITRQAASASVCGRLPIEVASKVRPESHVLAKSHLTCHTPRLDRPAPGRPGRGNAPTKARRT